MFNLLRTGGSVNRPYLLLDSNYAVGEELIASINSRNRPKFCR
jgi:hypothetical protein